MIKKEISKEELIEKFVKYATIDGEAKLSGDVRKGNNATKKMNKISYILREDKNLAETVYGEIMKSNSFRAKTLAAVECLRMNILLDEAVEILEKGSERKDVLGGGCYWALKIWRGDVPK